MKLHFFAIDLILIYLERGIQLQIEAEDIVLLKLTKELDTHLFIVNDGEEFHLHFGGRSDLLEIDISKDVLFTVFELYIEQKVDLVSKDCRNDPSYSPDSKNNKLTHFVYNI